MGVNALDCRRRCRSGITGLQARINTLPAQNRGPIRETPPKPPP